MCGEKYKKKTFFFHSKLGLSVRESLLEERKTTTSEVRETSFKSHGAQYKICSPYHNITSPMGQYTPKYRVCRREKMHRQTNTTFLFTWLLTVHLTCMYVSLCCAYAILSLSLTDIEKQWLINIFSYFVCTRLENVQL